jgi:WD repeat-containing protein 19
VSLTKDFLILLDSQGRIKYYNIEDDVFILESKSDLNIIKMYANKSGTRLVAIDSKGLGYLFEPSSEAFRQIADFPEKVERVCWDIRNNNEFVAISNDRYYTFIISKKNIFGRVVAAVREAIDLAKASEGEGELSCTVISKSNKTINLNDGMIYLLNAQAAITFVALQSHSYLRSYKREAENEQGHLRYFLQNLGLKRFREALLAAQFLKEDAAFEALGRKAIEDLEIELALKAYQLNQELSMVLALQSILHISDRFLINGNCAMLLGKYDLAQEYFLKSGNPVAALDMRCDVQDWTIAMNLARQVAPEQEPLISRRLATQVEAHGNNSEALKLYERAVISEPGSYDPELLESHNASCKAGIAKCCIKIGDVKRGYGIAREVREPALLNDVAMTCENMRQAVEAADLYERAGNFEKSTALYLQLKMYDRAAPLMQRVQSPKILVLYGQAKESERCYREAE